MGTAPILLLAETGLQIRNLLLGPFAAAVVEQRPLVAAVPGASMPALRPLLHDAMELVPYVAQPGPAPWWRNPDYYLYRLRETEKPTASLRLQTRLFEPGVSRKRAAVVSTVRGLGRLVTGSGAMGAVERAYLRSIERRDATRTWGRVLDEVRPSAVLSTMLTHSLLMRSSNDLPAVVAAHQRGIPVGSLVQSWDNLSSKTAVLPPWVDRYWAWSEHMRAELLALSPRVPPSSVEVVGSPHFDAHADARLIAPREALFARFGLDPAEPLIVIGTGTATWLPGEPVTTEAICRVLRSRMPRAQLIVRLHPKDTLERWRSLRPSLEALRVVLEPTSPGLHMDLGGFSLPDDFYREQLSALRHAAVVINTASTLTVDSALLDTPVVCVGFDVEPDPDFPEGRAVLYSRSTHYQPLVETGGVRVAGSLDALADLVRAYIEDPSRDRANRRALAAHVTATTDGSAGRNLAAAMLELAEQRPAVRTPARPS